jgi:hexosaminidase
MAAAAKGHDAVLTPAPLLYLDNRQGDGPAEPPGRGFLLRLRDVYAFNPTPPTVTPDAAKHLIGVQGNLWSEMIRTWPQLQAMAFPRASAVAELGWDAPKRHDWAAFETRLPAQFARYAALGVQADPAALTPRITAAPDASGALVTLAAQTPPAELRYTTDGSAPAAASPLYAQPFAAPLGAEVRAAAFLNGARIGPVAALRLDQAAIRRRLSQDLRLCNEKLSLNLEGPAAGRTFLINPQDACWLWPAADVTGVRRVTVAYQRLPFGFGLDAGHNTVIVHPPRQPAGEVEVREDGCLTDPVAVAPLTPGPVGSRGEATVTLPARTGPHDLCLTFTGKTYDPVLAVDWVQLSTEAAGP